jgi:hypothetical protein
MCQMRSADTKAATEQHQVSDCKQYFGISSCQKTDLPRAFTRIIGLPCFPLGEKPLRSAMANPVPSLRKALKP